MTALTQPATLEYRTDRVERLVLGAVLILLGSGALMFWNVERDTQAAALVIALIGVLFVGLGLFLTGFRRVVRLERGRGASEKRTLFGMTLAERRYPLTDFEAAGSRISASDKVSWDVALFRRDGGCLILVAWESNAEKVQSEITRAAQCLDLPAEDEPRKRTYLIGP